MVLTEFILMADIETFHYLQLSKQMVFALAFSEL